jgi:transcriptional regulator of acetoin/glycerol metabolism
MNQIAKARAKVNEQVARYLQAHPETTYEQVAKALGVSRWRVLTVAAGLGISRKTGPKPQITIR